MSRYLARSREGGVQTYVCPAKVAYIRAAIWGKDIVIKDFSVGTNIALPSRNNLS